MIAITAHFDLETRQFDVANAFLNSTLPYHIYLRAPDGFREANKALKLNKALYGLKESPML